MNGNDVLSILSAYKPVLLSMLSFVILIASALILSIIWGPAKQTSRHESDNGIGATAIACSGVDDGGLSLQ